MKDSTETVPSEYLEAFDLVRLKRLQSGSQGCCGGEGPVRSMIAFMRGTRTPVSIVSTPALPRISSISAG